MKKLSTITLLLVITSPLLAQNGWKKIKVGKIDSVYLYLKVKEYACAADDKWIGFEFENKSKDSLVSENWCYFSIDRKAYGWRGNLAQEINCYPFVKKDYSLSLIPPGSFTHYGKMSEEGGCMIGIPKPGTDTTEVFCTLKFELPLTKGKKLKIKNFKFSFHWYYPTDEQFMYLTNCLKQHLFMEKYNYYYFSMLMDNRRVADSIPIATYLKALTETKKDFNFRRVVTHYLDKAFPNDTSLISYFAHCIESDDKNIYDDILSLSNISPKLTDQLLDYLKRNINDSKKRGYLFRWFDEHKEKCSPKQVAQFQKIIIEHSLLTANPDTLSKEQFKNWYDLIEDLRWIEDDKLATYLIPVLKNEKAITIKYHSWRVIVRDSRNRIVFPPLRICDLVLETIYGLRGLRIGPLYQPIFTNEKGKRISWAKTKEEHQEHRQKITETRDRLIGQILYVYDKD